MRTKLFDKTIYDIPFIVDARYKIYKKAILKWKKTTKLNQTSIINYGKLSSKRKPAC